MYKVAAVGDRESILAFKAFGFETVPADTPEEAKEALSKLAEKDFAIIYLTEHLAAEIPEEFAKYAQQPTPAVILIPGGKGSLGIGMEAISSAVEKAVGADIFAGSDNNNDAS